MTRTLLTLAAATMLVSGAFPALAADVKKTYKPSEEPSTQQLEADAKEAWRDVKDAAHEAGQQIEALFLGEDENVPPQAMSYQSISSASGMIGAQVNGFNNKKVGTLHDILVNADGKATHAIVADNDIPGFSGKLVAVPYASVFQSKTTGDVSAALSEAAINGAREFSYTPSQDKNVVVLPAGQFSVAKILDSDVLNNTGQKVGAVDDMYFKAGMADTVIIGFDKTMGMGGQDVAANIGPASFSPHGEKVDVKLSAKQSSTFSKYKTSVTK